MFEMNKFDALGNNYTCLYVNGRYYVVFDEGYSGEIVFDGTFEECVAYITREIAATEDSLF